MRSHRAAIAAALEALAAGDTAHAESILTVLEDGTTSRPYKCPVCNLGLRWPGDVDHHLRFVHGVEVAA